MAKYCVLLLAWLPLAAALAYPIEVRTRLDATQIDYRSQDIAADLAGLTLDNRGAHAAQCTAVYRNGPEAPRLRRVRLAPGETVHLVVKLHRQVVRLRIELDCAPA